MYLFSLSGANSELDNQTVPDDVDTSPSLETTLSQVRIGEQVHMIVCADVYACVFSLRYYSSGATRICFCGGRVRGHMS